MSLVDCTECNRKISDQAVTCPGCGVPRSPVAPASSSFTGSPPLATAGVLPQIDVSELIAGAAGQDEISAELARRIKAFEPRFNESTMRFEKGSIVLTIGIERNRADWLVTARHNLPSQRGGMHVSTVVIFVVFLLLSFIFSWWLMAVFVAMSLYGFSMQPQIMAPELAGCLASTKQHFAARDKSAAADAHVPKGT